MVPIVQLVRMSDCGSEGRGFEPHLAPSDSSTKTCRLRQVFFMLRQLQRFTLQAIANYESDVYFYRKIDYITENRDGHP